MIRIQNQTEKVLVVYNDYFSVDIPIGEAVNINTELLRDDYKLFCRPFTARSEEVTEDFEIEQSRVLRRWHIYYEHISTFHPVTVFSVKDNQDLCLNDEMIHLLHILFKTVRLRKITVTPKSREEKEEYLFQNKRSKMRFLKLMRISVLLLPVEKVFLLGCIACLFANELDWMVKTMLIAFILGVSLLIFDDVYHYFICRKWKCLNEAI